MMCAFCVVLCCVVLCCVVFPLFFFCGCWRRVLLSASPLFRAGFRGAAVVVPMSVLGMEIDATTVTATSLLHSIIV